MEAQTLINAVPMVEVNRTVKFSIKHPIILEGEAFDFQQAYNKGVTRFELLNVYPGLTECPECGQKIYKEGKLVECPTCGAEFIVR